MDLKNVGGVFYVLCVGSAFATLYGLLEWLFNIYLRSREFKVRKLMYITLYKTNAIAFLSKKLFDITPKFFHKNYLLNEIIRSYFFNIGTI